PSEYGPAINTQYPIGSFLEDYEYVPGSGDLDEHNGRFCITPDYPNGIYAYFVTIDMYRDPVYPYTLGLTYYGTVQNGNMGGPQSGHNTIPDNATNYDATTSIETTKNQLASVYPNPTQDILFIQNPKENQLTILNILGETIFSGYGKNWNLNVRSWNNGVYLVKIGRHTERLVISH
nr:YHYH protein [Bacteroidota bacterium]